MNGNVVLNDINRNGDVYLIHPFTGHFYIVISEANGAKPCQALKENSPTSGLLRFLVAQSGSKSPKQGFSIQKKKLRQ